MQKRTKLSKLLHHLRNLFKRIKKSLKKMSIVIFNHHYLFDIYTTMTTKIL